MLIKEEMKAAGLTGRAAILLLREKKGIKVDPQALSTYINGIVVGTPKSTEVIDGIRELISERKNA